MILKGNQRGNALNLAQHLLRRDQNEHVTMHEIRGFAADNLTEALREAEAVSKGTRCRQYLFSLSLNPPEHETASVADFEAAITDIERKLGLKGQPRAIVFHEKEGRRHAHCVWSRIDPDTMTAINLPFYKRKLMDISKQLYLDRGWELPDGLRDRSCRDPLNFTRAEWQQAKRVKLDPRELKSLFKKCWETSDTRDALEHALKERGFLLARGDRRGFVAVDFHGETYALAKWTGLRAKQVKERLGDPAALPSVTETKARIAERMTGALVQFIKDVEQEARKRSTSLEFRRSEMAGRLREERKQLSEFHERRWITETNERAARLPKGVKGIWHRITGQYAAVRKENEREAWDALKRDRAEMDEMIMCVKARQKALPDATQPFWKKQRPKYLLSGLLKCGCCGGGFSKANHGRYGCSTARNKGTCGNKLKVDQFKLETLVTDALKAHLMDPELCAVFCTEYAAQMNRMRSEKNARLNSFRAELDRLEAGRKRLIEAIKSGVPGADVKDEMIAIGERRKIVEAELANIDEEPVLLHPAMAYRYQEEIERLLHTINDDECRAEATEIIRSLVDRIVLTPNEDGSDLQIDLHGDLAGIISIARKGEEPLETSDFETMVLKLVAEEGLEPPTRGL